MARSQNSFIKKMKAEKKLKKRKEKAEKKKERMQNNNKGGDLEDMIAYVDEYGNISEVPPDEKKEKPKSKSKGEFSSK